ncbi:MAG: leucine-rich repeat domain-containing protein [Ruminococcaceae bacterium]|nr:leucine-rich repeat domain-containing protein [Oscillospiraceae bacterium]
MVKKNNKFNIYQIVSVLLVLILVLSTVLPVYATEQKEFITSGTCGDKLKWSYSAGTLTITGEGAMTDFREPDMAPWYPVRDQITRLVLSDKITTIGNLAFYECTGLRSVILPDSVNKIGSYAFAECTGLESIKLGNTLSEIRRAAFYNCKKLVSVRFPYSLKKIDNIAFFNCEALTTITIPSYLSEMGVSVFAYCKNLIIAEINANLKYVPEWTFYGCEKLSIVTLPETVKSVERYAFKNCTDLCNVYFSGTEENRSEIKNCIVEDLPQFVHYGAVTNGTPSESNMSSTYTESEDGSVVQTNTTVTENDSMTVVTTIEHSYVKDSEQTGTYDIDIKVSLEDKNSWTDAKNTVNQILKSTNATLSDQAGTIDTDVIVYVKEGSLDNNFLADMANRDMTLTVVTPNGSTWRVDCSETKKTDIVGKTDYSYTVEEASGNSRDKLGTDDCYKVTFTESAKLNAEVIIKLPQSETNSNAFLYQVEKDGTHTRLQAVAVDNSGNAHFYLASVNDKTEYVIGVNVPNEKTDDVIIPDELLAQYGAIERLEKIEYVTTGLESSWGLGFKQVTWIMIGVLVGCAVVVGVFMGIMNKRKQKKIMSGGN